MNNIDQPLVSIVILNWNKPLDTITCIESVKEQTYKNTEIIIVDNGSIDNSLEILEKQKGIILLKNPKNRGFTGGHIDGLKIATGDFILVLNNDAMLEKEYITTAIKVISKDKNIAVVGGRSYVWGGKKQNDKLAGQYYAFQTVNRFSAEGIFAQTDVGYDHEVNWVSGSSMLIRKSTIDNVGYLYDPMFAYYEESDLFARLQAAGYYIVYSPSLRIHHKDGESSSSYFQFNQLFKNRFVFAIRNFDTKSIPSFIKSYSYTSLRGAYHHILRKSGDNNTIIINKALTNAFIHSALTWPRWIFSRRALISKDASGLSLNDKLKIEQTGISFICDLTNGITQLSKLADFIKSTSYKHYNSEVIVVCNLSDKKEAISIQEKSDLKNSNLRFAYSSNQFNTNPLNIGWLSSSKEYVWFITTELAPSIKSINKASLALNPKNTIYYEVADNKSVTLCIHRPILSIYGGLDSNSLDKSLANIHYFANTYDKINIHKRSAQLTGNLLHSTPSKILKQKVAQIIISEKQKAKRSTKLSKILEKNYRLYQLHNLITWLSIDVTLHHKLARIKNVVVNSARLNRKDLAIELKHISNEVIKSKYGSLNIEDTRLNVSSIINKQLINDNWKHTPVFIISRDRVTALKKLVKWLEYIGMTNITIIDNDSIYPPLTDYYNSINHQVIKTHRNIGHTVVWQEGIIQTLAPNDFYIVSDPDVIPDKNCPLDVIEYFYKLHIEYELYKKVGFGLKISDLPDRYSLKRQVIAWEQQFWKNELEPNIYEAGIDTTFALYKPRTYDYFLHPSIRTGTPYIAVHTPWYVDSDKIDDEEAFYRMRANQGITSWNTDEILERYKKELK